MNLPSVLRRVLPAMLVAASIVAAGCDQQKASPDAEEAPKTVSSGPVNLLVLDDAPLAAAIQRHWQARSEQPLLVREASADEVVAAEQLDADVIIYPAALIGEFAERQWLAPLRDDWLDEPPYLRRGVFELLRTRETKWGEKTSYAVTLGSPQLTLLYRADIFEQLGLQPPRTWSQYQQAVEKLVEHSASKAGEQGGTAATIEPLADGWAGQLLLARAAAYARHRSQYSTLFDHNTMEPLIASPAFVRALDELAAANRSDEATRRLTPAEARRELLAGRAAMAITWPTGAEPMSAEANTASALGERVKFAELPGSDDVYNFRDERWEPRESEAGKPVPLLAISGRLGSVARTARAPQAAQHVLAWIAGEDWGTEIATASDSTTLYRSSHTVSPRQWVDGSIDATAAADYAHLVQQRLNGPRWLFSVRIPGRHEYLAALDEAVRRTVDGQTSASEALQQAAERWREVTQQYGVEAQQKAYRRSLGLAD